jgi:hypothetical protein
LLAAVWLIRVSDVVADVEAGVYFLTRIENIVGVEYVLAGFKNMNHFVTKHFV